jgi:hypothetical protein
MSRHSIGVVQVGLIIDFVLLEPSQNFIMAKDSEPDIGKELIPLLVLKKSFSEPALKGLSRTIA